jgi:hypothetical protein
MTGKKGGKVRETYASATASYDGNMAKDDKKSKQKHDNKNAQEEIEGIFDFKDDDNSSLVGGIIPKKKILQSNVLLHINW